LSHVSRWALGVGAALALLLGGLAPAANAAPKPADTVLRNGFVYTVDQKNSVKQAIAIRGGKIVYTGTDKGVKRFVGKRTEVTNLGGKMVMPGIVDAHNHATSAGEVLLQCDLGYEALTVPDFQQRIQACLDEGADKEPDGWLQVSGWYRQAMLPEGTVVTKADLDGLGTSRPIVVQSSDGHSTLTNSRGLELAGITAATPDPEGGHIGRVGDTDEPNGILEDSAQGMVHSLIPEPTQGDVVQWARTAVEAMRADGVTSFMEQGATESVLEAYRSLRRAGQLTARASLAPNVPLAERATPAVAVKRILDLRRKYHRPLEPRPDLRVQNSGEISQDGGLQWSAQTASLFEPYLVNAGTEEAPNWVPGPSRGPDPYTPLPQLKRLSLALAKAGIEPEIHAIGDRAVHETLDAYAYVRKHLSKKKAKAKLTKAQRKLAKLRRSSAGKQRIRKARAAVKRARKLVRKADVRLLISHAEMVIPSDYDRFRKLDVIPAMGFWWASPDFDSIDAAKDYLGPERFNRMEPEGHLQRAGAKIALGSDWPVNALDSMYQLKVLTTREGSNPGEKYQGPLGEVPPVPIKPAIRAMTINGAYGMHQEKQTGSLEPGKFADLIVLDRNLLRIPARQIADTEVLTTMVGGKTVFRAE